MIQSQTIEVSLLKELCRTPLNDAARSRISNCLDGRVDWDVLLQQASRWDVEPCVFFNLKTFFAAGIPPAVLTMVEARDVRARATALAKTLSVTRLSELFTQAGIPVLIFKGPAVASVAYGDPSLRSLSDADLLVHKADLESAKAILLRDGFVPLFSAEDESGLIRAQHALEFAKSALKVELHFKLFSRYLRIDFDDDEIWEKTGRIQCAGSYIDVFPTDVLFVFLCAHGTKHEWASVKWTCDIAQLLQRMSSSDINAAASLARKHNAVRMVRVAMRLAADLGDTTGGQLGSMRDVEDPIAEKLVDQALNRRFLLLDQAQLPSVRSADGRFVGLSYWLRSRERRIDQLSSLVTLLMVPTNNDLGGASGGWITRPVRLTWSAMRSFFDHRIAGR